MASKKTEQAIMVQPKAYVFSMLMQKVKKSSLVVSPLLIVILEASSEDEALGLAMRRSQVELPGSKMIDWACCELICPPAPTGAREPQSRGGEGQGRG